MSGRNPTPPLKKMENKIRTRIWYKSVLQQSGLDNANQLSLATRWGDGRKWSDYARCRYTPNENSLADIEKQFPRTRRTFEYGPGDSYLFQAMCCSHKEILISRTIKMEISGG